MGDANSQGWTSLYQCPHLIVGVLGSLNEKGISHIQYADDIVLMTNGSNKSITNIKINYIASNGYQRVIPFVWLQQEEKEMKASMLNRRLGDLPMKYLGIPVSYNVLGIGAF